MLGSGSAESTIYSLLSDPKLFVSDMRGFLGCFVQFMGSIGVLLIFSTGIALNWFQLSGKRDHSNGHNSYAKAGAAIGFFFLQRDCTYLV